jgi:hypothetical protein
MLWYLSAAALAGTWDPVALEARLAEVAQLRALRMAADRPEIPAAARAAAAGGATRTGLQEVPGSPARLGWGVAVADTGIAAMFAALADDLGKPAFSSLESARHIGGERCGNRRRVFQYLPMTLVSDRWWVVDQAVNTRLHEASGGSVRETTWDSVQGELNLPPDVAEIASHGVRVGFTRGAWFLVSLAADRTWIEYHAWSDPGGTVPASIASRFATSGIPDAIEGMIRLARSGPGCPQQF